MKLFESSVSPKGQITLPLELRRHWGPKAEDRFAIQVDEDQVTVAPAHAPTPALSPLDSIYESVPTHSLPRSWREVTELAAEEHAQEAATNRLPNRPRLR